MATNNGTIDIGTPIGMTPAPNPVDPYTSFNNQISNMLADMASSQTAGNTQLLGARDTLTSESVSPNGPTPFNPAFSSASQIGAQQALQAGFTPAITSINSQLQNSATSYGNAAEAVKTIAGLELPQPVSAGQSLVTPAGQMVYQGHSYTFGTNPMTLLPDAIDETGQWASSQGITVPNTPAGTQTNSIADLLGNSNSLGAYATDPNYLKKITSLYNTVVGLKVTQPSTDATGKVTSAADNLAQYIRNNGGNAGLAGAILNTAQTLGVNVDLMTAQALEESDFGTAGQAPKNNNPFGIMYVGQADASQGTPRPASEGGYYAAYKSMSAGVLAYGQLMQARAAATTQTPAKTPGNTGTSNVGGTFSDADAKKVAQLPTVLQNYTQAGLFGTAYIDVSRVPLAQQPAMAAYAAKAGIPYLDQPADVASAQALTQAQANMNLMKNTATDVLGSGFWGAAKDIAATTINNVTFGNAFPDFNKFNAYATAAVNQLKALAGSGGGFRITQSEINTAQENLPVSTDTIQNAKIKMGVLQGLIDTTVAKLFPDAQVPVLLPNGTKVTVPAKNYSTAVNLGATPL